MRSLPRASGLAVNFVLLSGGEFLGKILVALAFAYLARVLGPALYGQLEFTLALLFFFTLVVDTGLTAFGAREIAKDTASAPRLVAHIVALRAALSFVSVLVLVLLALALDKPWNEKQLLLVYALTLFELPGLLPFAFQGRDWMQYVALASITRWGLFTMGVFALVRGPEQIWLLPLVEGLALLGSSLVYAWAHRRHWGALRERLDARYALGLVRRSLPIGASELVWNIKVYFATVFLGLLVGGAEVGWFTAAHRLVISLHAFVWLYFFNLLPSLARAANGAREDLRRLLNGSIQITVWGAVFIGITGTALAEPFLLLLYGPQYRESILPFQVLIWLIPLTLISGNYRYTLIAADRQNLEFASALAGAILNIALNLFLVPRIGLTGAAVALVASEALILVLAYTLVQGAVLHTSLWVHLLRPLGAGALLALTLYLLPPVNMLVIGGVAVVVYGLVLVLLQRKLVTDVRALFVRNS